MTPKPKSETVRVPIDRMSALSLLDGDAYEYFIGGSRPKKPLKSLTVVEQDGTITRFAPSIEVVTVEVPVVVARAMVDRAGPTVPEEERALFEDACRAALQNREADR